jgi:hypothetical protein
VTRAEVLAVLRATPDRLAAAAAGLPAEALVRRPASGEWSIAEVASHLRLGERDLMLPRFRRMLAEDGPVFPTSVETRTGFAAEPVSQGFAADLAGFREARAETLRVLGGLAEADWGRIGTTPTRGTLSLEAYARYLAEHDLEHLRELDRRRALVSTPP